MFVRDAMTPHAEWISPDLRLVEVARKMRDDGIGCLPVGENDRLVGMITDRDLACRAVAEGKGPDTPVREVMSTEQVLYCFEDEDLNHVAENMSDERVRRLPVMNREKRLVGIVSLGDVAVKEKKAATKAVTGVSKPGGPKSQKSTDV